MLYLESDRLRVEIAHPHESPNTTFRFDRAAFITEVTLDGEHRFCATEPYNLSHPTSGGRGLCCEFQLDVEPMDFPGDKFPKMGIGVCKKPESGVFLFYGKYDADLYPIKIEEAKDSITFITEPIDYMGYAAWQKKVVSVKGNTLTLSVEIKNVGTKTLNGREYCHNFVSIDGMAVNPDYRVVFPEANDMGDSILDGFLHIKGKEVHVDYYDPVACEGPLPFDKIKTAKGLHWSLINEGAGAKMDVQDDINFVGTNLWAADHMMSLESFNGLTIEPGETACWKRTWTFDTL